MKSTRVRALITAAGMATTLLMLVSASPALAKHGRYAAAAEFHSLSPRVDHRFEGIVPSARAGGRRHGRPTKGEFAGTQFASGSNLQYWGGPVMGTNKTYTIYWQGTGSYGSGFDSSYQPVINGFFSNVAAAQNATNDVYAVDTQYSNIANQSSVGGTVVDTTNPIPNDCSAEYARTGVAISGCVTDTDIQAEVSRMIQAQGWTPGSNAMFFVFTPQNVGSCFDTTSGECAYTYYCAYHSNFYNSSNQDVIYADQPYSEIATAPGACDSGEYPNGDPAADSTVNLVSHEHNEAITDPDGNAWFDSSGNEIGDKCAWNFGAGPWSSTGLAASSQYNQQIGSGDYYLQQEWSNASTGCALSYGGAPPAASLSVTGFSPSAAKTGTRVTINGTGFASGSTVSFNGVASSSVSYVSSTQLTATVPSAASSGPITVTLSNGTSASSTSKFNVQPNITSFSPTSGPRGTVVTINGSGFVGASSVIFKKSQATFTVVSANKITATVPSGAGTGRITVRTPSGSAQSATNFTVT